MSTTTQAARDTAPDTTTARRPSARAPRPQPIAACDRARAVSATLLETEQRIRAAGIVRMHCLLVAADGHAVRLAGERRGAPIVYGGGADLAEAMADLFRNVARDAQDGAL